MPKKIKLSLNDLSVSSFKTAEQKSHTVGGSGGVQCSDIIYCQNTQICWSEVVCNTNGNGLCIVRPD